MADLLRSVLTATASANAPRTRERPGVSTLSAKAQRLGLLTPADVEKEFRDAKQGWSKGTDYHCPSCDKDFWSPSGARKHMKAQGHPVLRVDWY